MELTNKEKKIKDLYQSDHIQLDTDSLWSEIESQVEHKDTKRRKAFWLYLLPGLALMLGIYNLFLFQSISDDKTSQHIEQIEQSAIKQQTVLPSPSLSDNITSNNNQIESKTTSQSPSSANDSHSNPQFLSSQYAHNFSSTTYFSNQQNSNLFQSDLIEKSQELLSSLPLISQSTEVATQNLLLPLHRIPQISALVNYNRLQPEITNLSIVPIDIVKTARPYFISLAIGPNLSFSQTSKIGELSTLDRFESGVVNGSLILEVGRTFSQGWSAGIGLSYHGNAIRYDRNDQIVSEELLPETNQVIDEMGRISSTPNQLIEETTVTFDVVRLRLHQQADVRAFVSKSFQVSPKFVLSPKVGLGYNLLTRHSGYTPANNSTGISMRENEEASYNSLGLKWDASLEFQYVLTDRFGIICTPSFVQNLNNLPMNNHDYNITNSQLSLTFGVTYRPNWE